jgi:hypothetical protein
MSSANESVGRRVGGKTLQVSAAERSELVEIGRRFARFREEHRPGARIPDELREAALAVLGKAAPAEVFRACKISFGQVVAWKQAQARASETKDARVFSVVNEEPVPRLAPTATVSAAAPALELRLGPWSVSVRQVGTPGEVK